MTPRFSLVIAAIIGAQLSLSAAEASPFPKGLFSSEKGCPSQDIHSLSEPTLMNAKGLEAIEWNCEFAEIRSVFGGAGWLIDAACNAPGEFYPQQFLAFADERDDQGPTRMRLADGGSRDSVTTEFYRCPKDP